MMNIGKILIGLLLLAYIGAAAANEPVAVIFDTDIMGDVDDVGSVATLVALVNRGEAKILAMGVCSKGSESVQCLNALNTWFGMPDIGIGVNKGEGFLRDSKYNRQIAEEFPHKLKSADEAPSAALLYRKVLAGQADGSVVMISVGQLSNMSELLKTPADEISPLNGKELVSRKIKAWVCMGAKFPQGKEANIWHHASAAVYAVKEWPTPIIFSGFEIGVKILTGGKLKEAPESSPVRRAYQLYNGIRPHKSWDQTAVLYGVRGIDGGLKEMWDTERGVCTIDADGTNHWQKNHSGRHLILKEKQAPAEVARVIEELMMEEPK